MLGRHQHVGLLVECEMCGRRWDDPTMHYGVPGQPRKRKSADTSLWPSLAFLVTASVCSGATIYNICVGRWDHATFFLVLTLAVLWFWDGYES